MSNTGFKTILMTYVTCAFLIACGGNESGQKVADVGQAIEVTREADSIYEVSLTNVPPAALAGNGASVTFQTSEHHWPHDWIGIFAAEAPISAAESSATVPHHQSVGTLTLLLPVSAFGTYEFRYYSKQDALLAVSESFVVSREMRLTIPPWESYFVGEPITVSWSGLGRDGDRLAIVLADEPSTEVASIATAGASTGGHPFDSLAEGYYEARLLDMEGRLIAASSQFTIVTLEPAAVSTGCDGLSWINDAHHGQWLTITKSGASGGETLLVGHARGEATGCMSVRFPPGDYVGELLDAELSAVGASAEFHVERPGWKFDAFTLTDIFYAHQPIDFYWAASPGVPMDMYYYGVLDTTTGTGDYFGPIQVIPGFMEDGFVTANLPPGDYSMHIWNRWGSELGSSSPTTVLASPVATDKETYVVGDPIELSWDSLANNSGLLVVAFAGSMPWEFLASCPVAADLPSSCTVTGAPVGHYEIRYMGNHSTNVDVFLSLDVSSPDPAPMP